MKRLFCALLAASTLFATTPCYAAEQLVIGIEEDFCETAVYVDGERSIIYEGIEDLEYLYDVIPGTTFFLPLIGSDFIWEDRSQEITLAFAGQQGIGVECDTLSEENISIIDSASIKELDGMVGISISFTDTLLSANSVPFELTGQLTIPTHSESFTLKGTLRNRRVIVADSNQPIRLGAGRMGMAYESHDSLDLNLGDNVILHSPVVAYDELIGVAVERHVSSDIKSEYPPVEKLYTLQTLNLKGTVSFDLEDLWYVYSGNMTYLGTSQEMLPQQSRYYLSRIIL